MKTKTFGLALVVLLICNANTTSSFAQPSPDEDRKWCQQEEAKLAIELKLPKDFDEKKVGKLRAIVLFHLTKDGHATKIKPLRKNAADRAEITIPEKKFVEVENAMIAAVKSSEPMKPIPPSFSKDGEGVSFAYEPKADKRIRVLVVAE